MTEKEELQIFHGKKIVRLEPHYKENQTTHSRLKSVVSEVCEIKVSLLELHDTVSILTFMLDTFMKDMKGMVVEEVTVEKEPVKKEEVSKEEVSKEEEATQEGKEAEEEEKEAEKKENPKEIDATSIQTIPPTVEATPITTSPGKPKASKKRKTRSCK